MATHIALPLLCLVTSYSEEALHSLSPLFTSQGQTFISIPAADLLQGFAAFLHSACLQDSSCPRPLLACTYTGTPISNA